MRALEGKIALVTGSSSGIGEAIARRLAKDGAIIIVHGRNRERAERVAAELAAGGTTAYVVLGDLKREAEAKAVADFALSLGGVDILVNNAGGESAGYGTAAWFETTSDDWMSTYDANVASVARMIRSLAPAMIERGWGRMIQISSVVGHAPLTLIPDFGAAKAALRNLTISLAKALAGTGVTSNSISPGLVLTAGVEGWLRTLAAQHGWGDDWAEIERRAATDVAHALVGRVGRPEEIAHAAAYLAHPLSGFMTGADILIDGGQSIPPG